MPIVSIISKVRSKRKILFRRAAKANLVSERAVFCPLFGRTGMEKGGFFFVNCGKKAKIAAKTVDFREGLW